MPNKVYILHDCNSRLGLDEIWDVYSSKENALTDLFRVHEKLIYSEKYNTWEFARAGSSRYFYISEHTIK